MSANTALLYRYGRSLNTHDALKILAIVLMVIDHVGWYLLNDYMPCRLIGRASAPLFFFLIGYSGKVHLSGFLIIYGIILSLTGSFLMGHFWINILLNFILVHFLLHYYPLEKLGTLSRLFAIGAFLILTIYGYRYLEYGFLGVILAYGARSIALQEKTAHFWLGVGLFIFGFFEAVVFNFISQPLYLASLITLFFGLYYLLSHFQLRPFNVIPSKLILPSLFISRYSLHIYFYHLILLQFYIVLTSRSIFYLIGL